MTKNAKIKLNLKLSRNQTKLNNHWKQNPIRIFKIKKVIPNKKEVEIELLNQFKNKLHSEISSKYKNEKYSLILLNKSLSNSIKFSKIFETNLKTNKPIRLHLFNS